MGRAGDLIEEVNLCIVLLHRYHLKPCTGLNEVEVAVFMKEGKIVFNAYGGDDAIDRPPYCLALLSTVPIKPGGMKVGLDTLRSIHWKLKKVVPYRLKFRVVLDPLENLCEDNLRHRDILFVLYESVEHPALGGVLAPQEVHPYAGVHEDHALLFLIS